MTLEAFRKELMEGIPSVLPAKQEYDANLNHAPKRKEILNIEEKKLALKKAQTWFTVLAKKHMQF